MSLKRGLIKQQFLPWLASFAFVSFLTSCSDSEVLPTHSQPSSAIATPQLVRRMSIPEGGQLSARVTIDGSTFPMEIDSANDQMSFSTQLESGTYDVTVELFYESPTVATTRLVAAQKSVNVQQDQHIAFGDVDFVYDNSDADAIVNVVEIEFGSDPYDSGDVPALSDADDNYEKNNTYISAYDVTGYKDIFINSRVQTNTSNGRLTTADSSDVFKMTLTEAQEYIELDVAIDYGLKVALVYLQNGQPILPDVEFISDEDQGGYNQVVMRYANPAPQDYYLVFFEEENPQGGTYSFGWTSQ